ncbi:hypothetical protein OGATHE_006144 [Ogataea polymorpha]|uniref:Uncharacterized protein n=1 Tax=Ogataea polymorpha TaxID=460523 RepID=A0A9P8NTI4_9ASCO|nr:hypothetical protein OGATHE_006144 [Ogataea polymorpha]
MSSSATITSSTRLWWTKMPVSWSSMSHAQLTPLWGSRLKIGDSQFSELIADKLVSETLSPIETRSISEMSATISILPLLEKSLFQPDLSSPDLITRISSTYSGVSVVVWCGCKSLLVAVDSDGAICGVLCCDTCGANASLPACTDHVDATGTRSGDAVGDVFCAVTSLGSSFSSVVCRRGGCSK